MLNLQLSPLAGWFLGPGPYSYYSWQEVATSKNAALGDNFSSSLKDISEYNCDSAASTPLTANSPKNYGEGGVGVQAEVS